MAEGQPVEIVNFKVTGIGVIPKPAVKKFAPGSGQLPSPEEVRRVYFDSNNSLPVPVYRRSLLRPGVRIQGPAVIEETTSTTVLYPGQRARVDDYLNLEVELEASE